MSKILQKFVIFLSFFCGLLNICHSKLSDDQVLQFAKHLENIIERGKNIINIPGVTFAVARNGKVIYTKSIGQTTVDKNNPKNLSNDFLFPLSSVSKNVTAILVGALVDDGKISFNDKVRKYYPEFYMKDESLSNEMTIRDLLSHRSGFEHFAADTLFKGGYSNEKVLDAFKYLKHNESNFRRVYEYQNIVFGIIGIVLERATGEKYEDLVQKYIFDKMEMKTSSAISLAFESSKFAYFKYMCSRFGHDKKRLGFFSAIFNLTKKTLQHKSKKIVTSHSRYNDEIIPLDQIGMFHKFPATSGISFSAEDFGKWMEMLASNGKYKDKIIISEKTFNELTSKHSIILGLKDDDVTFPRHRYSRKDPYYGMGFFKFCYSNNDKDNRDILCHMGGIYGSTAYIAVVPEEDISIGVVSNLGGVSITLFSEYMVNQFLDLCFGFEGIDWIQADIDRKNKFRTMQQKFFQNIARIPQPHGRLEKYVGRYTNEIYGDLNIELSDDYLYLSNGIRKVKLNHLNGTVFTFPSKDMMYIYFDAEEYMHFILDQKGNVSSLIVSCFAENDSKFIKR
ncbi:MAG: serine hydrolase [Alphaproteobacteria bacterium]|nr:serine hydrolase [Alphaproteobacteria bacterium]